MKRKWQFIMVLMAAGACAGRAGLIFSDSFNYAAGGNLSGQGGWSDSTSTGHGEVGITAGNLSVSGLASSSGNLAAFRWGNNNLQTPISVSSGTTLYYSLALDITSLGNLSASGDYFVGISSAATSLGGTLWARKDGTGFDLGISTKSSSTVSWSSTSYAVNSTIYLVAEYNVVSGSANDTSALWINPSSVNFGAASAPAATLTGGSGSTDLGAINNVFIRPDPSTFSVASGGIRLDEFRVGTSWADVTPIPEPAAWGAMSGIGLLALCGRCVWRQRRFGKI
jgi:hypothetical protein